MEVEYLYVYDDTLIIHKDYICGNTSGEAFV